MVALNVLSFHFNLALVKYVFACCTDPLIVVVTFFDYLYGVLCSIDISLFSNFLLLGDFNIDFLAQNHPLFSKLVCITSSFYFTRL